MTSTLPPALRGLARLLEEVDTQLPPHAERVRIRKDAGLSQRALSLALGVAERNVCNWEKADAPEPTARHRLLYRVALQELARRTGDRVDRTAAASSPEQ